jgi:hypothetical protein
MPSIIYLSKLYFWYENKPSGSPDSLAEKSFGKSKQLPNVHSLTMGGRCYDFENIFAKKSTKKIGEV